MGVSSEFGSRPILAESEVSEVLPVGALLMGDLHTALVGTAIVGRDESSAKQLATRVCNWLFRANDRRDTRRYAPFINQLGAFDGAGEPILVEFLTSRFTQTVLEAETSGDLCRNLGGLRGLGEDSFAPLKRAVDVLVRGNEKEPLSFQSLVDSAATRFVQWNAYDGFGDKDPSKLPRGFGRIEHPDYALGMAIDVVIDEIVEKAGISEFYRDACGMMKDMGQLATFGQLDALKSILKLGPEDNEAREAAEILVKSLVGMKVMEALKTHEGVRSLCAARFSEFWMRRIDLF